MSHPSLSPAEAERLECLAEEAAEVIQACMKILRHGYHNFHPADVDRITNQMILGREIGNLNYVCEQMHLAGDLHDHEVVVGEFSKSQNWPRYTYHQPTSRKSS